MKKITIVFISTMLLGLSIMAQAPQAFKYQAVARDIAGNLLTNQNVSFRISILQGSAGGTSIFSETHSLTTNDYGLANLNVGGGTPVSGNFSTINWGSNTYFIKVEMDPLGGSAYQLMGTSQLLSVPYALYARNSADGVGTGISGQTLRHNGTSWVANSNLFNNGTNVGIGTTTPSAKLHVESPTCISKLVSSNQSVYGEHSTSGSYGWLGASNEGGYGYSANGYGLRGQTTNGYGIHGTATGTGFAAYFDGKAFFSGNVGIGEVSPAYKLDVNGTIRGTVFYGDGSGLTGIGDNLGNHTATANLKMNNFWISGDGQSEGIYVNSLGNVGIGTNNPNPATKLSVAANAGPNIVIHDANASNDRPGIQFTNNYIHYIGGDDGSDEYFGFYSVYGNNRTYDAVLNIHGKATDNWGRYLSLTHNGTSGRIFTDVGDLLLQPAGGVAINTSSAGIYKLAVTGDVLVTGSIKTNVKNESIIIPPAAFVCRFQDRGYHNGGDIIWTEDLIFPNNCFFAPVYLPSNAIVVKVTTYWEDNSTSTASLLFSRSKLSDGSGSTLSDNETYWQSTVRNYLVDTSIDDPVIDNNNYMYTIQIWLYNDIKFYGAKIEYTYDEIK